MDHDLCAEMALLLQADLDNELRPAEAARLVAHLHACPGCTQMQALLADLSLQLRAQAPHYAAPATLRAALSPSWPALARRMGAPFAAGIALAACLAVVAILPRQASLPDEIVAAHIRALQPGHLMDVLSTDQHTVKPWFDGRLPFAPPVKDLATAAFPLVGGRLDYLPNHQAATLIYRRRQHVIDLFVWPGVTDGGPSTGARAGYNFIRWSTTGMTLWAVSDLNSKELGDFVTQWQAR